MEKFILRDALSFAWGVYKKDYGFLITVVLVSFIISLFFNFVPSSFDGWTRLMMILLGIAVGQIMYAGIIQISLNYTYNTRSRISDLFAYARFAPKLLLAGIIFGIIVFIGLLLLIVPGIYLALRFSQISYFIVDKDMGIIDAFKFSSEVTKGVKIDLFVYFIIIFLLTLLAILPLLLGLLIAIPIFWISSAFIYRELVRNTYELNDLVN